MNELKEQTKNSERRKKSMKKTVFTLTVIIWMGLIFWFSAQPARKSGEMSASVGVVVGKLFVPGFSKLTEAEQLEFAQKIDYPVRKTAHAAEYAVLGALLAAMYRSYGLLGKRWIWTSFLTAVLYAATDEFHQLFVSGRACRATDVMIDGTGALAGVLLLAAAVKALRRRG